MNSQNQSSGNTASTDYVATPNNASSDTDVYIDLGINGSGYAPNASAFFGYSFPNDGYLYVQGNTTTGGGNLMLATMNSNNVIFYAVGGQNQANVVHTTTSTGLVVNVATSATSSVTGALRVAGGVGINGSLYTAGTGTFNTLNAATIGNASAVLYGTLNSSSASQPNITTLAGVTSIGASSSTTLTGTLQTAAQTNITSVGTLAGLTVSAAIVPNANASVNLGSTTAWWNNIYGTATHAQYADLAENYRGDRTYNPGTVLMFGGTDEVTVADADTTRIAGVVSTNPAHLMNGALMGTNIVPVALVGRVPCNVVGPIAKGDLMVAAGFGFAKANNSAGIGQVIGKALEDFPIAAKGVIEVVVGRL
jgi:hypothetical protein